MSFRAADGRTLPVRTHRAGDIFGASGLLDGGDGSRRDTATAIEPTVLKAIPHARFHSLMRQNSAVGETLRRASTFSALNEGGSRTNGAKHAGASPSAVRQRPSR